MNRHPNITSALSHPRNLRLAALVLAFVAINQVDDPLLSPTMGQEALYWCVRLSLLSAGLWLADWWVSTRLSDRWQRPAWLGPVLIVSIVGLIPLSLAEILVEPHLPIRPEYQDGALWAISPVLAWLAEYATILSILLPVHLLIWLVVEHREAKATESTETNPSLPEFLQGTSARSIADVLALQAEEHYVRVYTALGSELTYGRFSDAAAAMAPEIGLRVHRSWWVRSDAVQSAKRGARRWSLVIGDDLAVPVSDSYVAAVREAGLLKR